MPKNSAGGSVSNAVISRLPRYFRIFEELKKAGVTRVSSNDLSERIGFTASQIRQDFSCFGGFGQQGYGYNVEQLYYEIGLILGVGSHNKAIIIGAGNLGKAIATHMNFESRGCRLIGIFDKKESITGQMIRGIPVRNLAVLDEFCRENQPKIAMLCIPPDTSKELVEQLINLKIKAFWNFSNYDISSDYPYVIVENVHLNDSLMTLCYKINHSEEATK